MSFLTNWIFWAIIVAIIIVMAIIGYLAEGTALGRKKNSQNQKNTNNQGVGEISSADEAAPSAWTGEVQAEDKTHEQIHEVPQAEDWTTLPTSQAANEATIPQTESEGNLFNETLPDSLKQGSADAIGNAASEEATSATSVNAGSALNDVPDVINLDEVSSAAQPVAEITVPAPAAAAAEAPTTPTEESAPEESKLVETQAPTEAPASTVESPAPTEAPVPAEPKPAETQTPVEAPVQPAAPTETPVTEESKPAEAPAPAPAEKPAEQPTDVWK